MDSNSRELATDVAAAERVVLAYHRAIDTGHATEGVELFTDDAVFQAKGTELVGRDAISCFLEDRESQTDRHTLHVVANTVAQILGHGEIEISAFVLLYVLHSDDHYELDRVLDTTHVVRRTPSGWQVCQRLSHRLHAPARAAVH